MDNPDLRDDDVIMQFERAFLITVLLFGVFLLWCCVMGKEGSAPQPRTYVYEGDTVATEDDCQEIRQQEEGSKAATTKGRSSKNGGVGSTPTQVPNDICLAQGSDDSQEENSIRDVSCDESSSSVMVAISEADEGSDVESQGGSPV